jgi:transposase InsO family protein
MSMTARDFQINKATQDLLSTAIAHAGQAMRHIYELSGCRISHNSGGRSLANGKVERIHQGVRVCMLGLI